VAEESQIAQLRRVLIDEALAGIERTTTGYAFGAFQLTGALMDTVAGLAYPRKGSDADRFARLMRDYFPGEYDVAGLPERLYQGMRCRTLHNLSIEGLLLLDRQQPELHLRTGPDGRVIVRLQDLLCDLRSAIQSWLTALDGDAAGLQRVSERLRLYPLVQVELIAPADLRHVGTFAATQSVPTAFASPEVAVASGATRQRNNRPR
jgi:hypothetical protein